MSVYPASIDDNDPQVEYSSGWQLVTQDGSWTGTMHSTSVIGSWARVRFTGSRVAVVCTIPTGSGSLSQASFSLDNGPAVNEAHVTTPPVQWQTVFWDSGPLPFGSHLVVMTNTGNQAYFRLDHIDYDPTNGSSPPSSSSQAAATTPIVLTTTVVDKSSTSSLINTASFSTTSSTTNLTSSTQPTLGVPNTSMTQSLPSSSSSSAAGTASAGSEFNSGVGSSTSSTKSGTPLAAILAGVLGAILAILLVAGLLVFFIRRRRNRAQYLDDSVSGPSSPARRRGAARTTIPTPFSLDTSHEMSTSNLVTVGSYSNAYTSFGHSGRTQEGNYTPRSASPVPTDANSPVSGSGLRHSMPASSSIYTYEEAHVVSGHMSRPYHQQNSGGWTVGGGGVGSKHAEAFGRDGQLVDVSTSEYGGTFRSVFQDAPPAYPGRVPSFLGPRLGEGVER